MLISGLPGGAHILRAASLLALVSLTCAPVCAADLDDATQLLRSGQRDKALVLVDKVIQSRPDDAHARFMKGLILAESGNTREASEVFLKLTRDFPRLPEPYNNLAVIYAAQGQYEQARTMLEQAMRTHPTYATAYDNLSGVYAKLASRAYDKALQLDSAPTAGKNDLALMRELTGSEPRPASAAQKPSGASVASGTIRPRPQTPDAGRPASPAQVAPVTAAAPPSPKKPEAGESARTGNALAAVSRPAPSAKTAPGSPRKDIASRLNAWAAAWSRKDVDAYLGFYAEDFAPPGGETRAQWAQSRRSRLTAPRSISVSLGAPKIALTGEDRATATFRQNYESDVFRGSSVKTLVLVKTDGLWRIRQERVGQ